MLRRIVVFLCLSLPAHAFMQIGIENNFFTSYFQEINIKSRVHLMFGGNGFYIGAVGYYNRPYADFNEVIYGAGIRIGEKWVCGLNAGILQRSVFNIEGDGYAATLLFAYAFTETWYLSVPVTYKVIDEGDLNSRVEGSLLPYIGIRIDI